MLLTSNGQQNSQLSPIQWHKQPNSENSGQLQIQATGAVSSDRKGIEQFIKTGFKKCYNANINVTTPYLISLKKGSFKSALGLRSAKSALFIEQYLNNSIEDTLAEKGEAVVRKQIAEIAHLYSNSRTFTLPLLLVTATSLKLKGFELMAFTGTAHVIRLIQKTGIKVHELAAAEATKLAPSSDSWGSYYTSQPVVAYINLNNVLSIIDATPKLSQMFTTLTAQIANVVGQLDNL